MCDNFNFRQEIEFGCYLIILSTVILRKCNSVKASSHYFVFFSHSVILIIYVFIGHKLTNFYVLYAWMILNSLTLYVIACYDRSNI